jgi:rod shape determining protein RodA
VTIILMAALVSAYRGKLNTGKDYVKICFFMFVPIVLIMLQPDLGTGMVLLVIGLVILFTGGANRRWFLITILALLTVVVIAFAADPMVDQMIGHDTFIKDYQKDRLLVFLDNDIDPGGVSYNLAQSKIAIGSGGFSGKGFGMATQAVLGFLPEAPTDFIFCVLAEQFGFVGALALLLLFLWLLASAFATAQITEDLFGSLIIMGIMAMWTFQIVENIGMDCGIMPITGIPLPFVSYGSSFMLVNFAAIGLILSVHAHRETDNKQDMRHNG